MKQNALPVIACLLLAACTKENLLPTEDITGVSAVAKKGAMATESQTIQFMEENLFPEGVVYDKFNDRFYVSSTRRGDVGIVTQSGDYTPFITDPALVGTAGLEIDNARKLLYVSNTTAGSVGVYNINTGERVRLIDLENITSATTFFINDIALDPQGNAYVTNSRAPEIYKISPDGTATLFYRAEAFTTTGFGFNGIEYGSSGGGYLLVAYTVGNQVIKFPVGSPSDYSVVSLDATLARPDGLLLSKDEKSLVVVNNAGGGAGKVTTFVSKDKWQTATLTNTYMTGPVFPTTATTDGKSVYVLYAYLNQTNQTVFTIQQVPGTQMF